MILEKYDKHSIIKFMSELIEHILEKTNAKINVVAVVGSSALKGAHETCVVGYEEDETKLLLINALKGFQKEKEGSDLHKALNDILK